MKNNTDERRISGEVVQEALKDALEAVVSSMVVLVLLLEIGLVNPHKIIETAFYLVITVYAASTLIRSASFEESEEVARAFYVAATITIVTFLVDVVIEALAFFHVIR